MLHQDDEGFSLEKANNGKIVQARECHAFGVVACRGKNVEFFDCGEEYHESI